MELRERALSIGLCLASGLAFGLAFPPARLHALAWITLAPLFVALRSGSARHAAGLVWLWCLAAAWSVGDWFPRSVADYFGQPMPVAVAMFFAVFTVMAGPYYLIGALAYRAFARRFRLTLPLLAAAAWVVAELGRGRLFTGTAFFIGNPWGLLGYSHADVPEFAQIAAWTGIYGMSFAIVAVNAGLAELVIAWRRGDGWQRPGWSLVVGACPALLVTAVGYAVLAETPRGDAREAVVVAIAQGNVAVGSTWRADAYDKNLGTDLRLTQAAAERERPRVVVWPESAMTFFLEKEPIYLGSIAGLLGRHDLQLVAGGPRQTGDDADAYTNSVYVVEPDGALSARYDKEYLVPFSEYFPFEIDLLRRRFGRIRSFEQGARNAPFATRAGSAGVLICNEAMLPEAAGRRVAAGAELLINPSNDSWIPDAKYTQQQLDIARMRAVEQRRWLVRASTAGPSAIVDPWGRPTAVTESGGRAVAVGEVWPRQDRTVYARVGDLFGALCSVVVGLAWWRSRADRTPRAAREATR